MTIYAWVGLAMLGYLLGAAFTFGWRQGDFGSQWLDALWWPVLVIALPIFIGEWTRKIVDAICEDVREWRAGRHRRWRGR